MPAETERKARLAIWCPTCEVFSLITDKKFDNHCPKCGEYLTERRCIRCGHRWVPKTYDKLARVCPNPRCKSPLWDRERVLKRK